jgi:hypothetical protein
LWQLSSQGGVVQAGGRSPAPLLALWDPASNGLTDLTPTAPAIFQAGVGVMARSGDYSRVLAAANDATGAVAVLDSGGNLVAGPQALGSGIISFVAANADGSRFAVAFTASGGPQVLLLDSGLNVLGSYPSSGAVGLAFSRDRQMLYVSKPLGNSSAITVLSTTTLTAFCRARTQFSGNSRTGPEFIPPLRRRRRWSRSRIVLPYRPASPPATGIHGGIGIRDAHNGQLRLRIYLPVGIGTLSPASGPASGGTSITLRGSGFQTGTKLRLAGSPRVSRSRT